MRRIRMKKSRKYEQDKLQAAINASARRALDDLDKSSGMWPTMIGVMAERIKYDQGRNDKNYCSGIKNGRNSKKFISKADCNS